jgi:hypothetical protein
VPEALVEEDARDPGVDLPEPGVYGVLTQSARPTRAVEYHRGRRVPLTAILDGEKRPGPSPPYWYVVTYFR